MKLGVIGSRNFNNYDLFLEKMGTYFESRVIEEIISGGATGGDALGKRYAEYYQIKYTEFLPDWNKHGKSAGPIRNEEIIKASDCVIAFYDGSSRGTASSIEWAKKYKKDTIIIYF